VKANEVGLAARAARVRSKARGAAAGPSAAKGEREGVSLCRRGKKSDGISLRMSGKRLTYCFLKHCARATLFVFFVLLLFRIAGSDAQTDVTVTSAKISSTCEIRDRLNQIRRHRVVVLVDSTLLEVFLNWAIYYHAACPGSLDEGRLVVVCMDARVRSTLTPRLGPLSCSKEHSFALSSAKKAMTSQEIKVSKQSNIWVKRVEIVSKILAQGSDVVLFDADALLLRGPGTFKDLSLHQTANDLVASRAWWPWEQHKQWGATLCMGFLYIKSTPFSVSFFAAVEADMLLELGGGSKLPDDQSAVNKALALRNLTWQGGDDKLLVAGSTQADLGSISIFSSSSSAFGSGSVAAAGVVLLPHDKYPRQCHGQDIMKGDAKVLAEAKRAVSAAHVAHCRLAKGELAAKRRGLKGFGLWRLARSWRYSLKMMVMTNNGNDTTSSRSTTDAILRALSLERSLERRAQGGRPEKD
jgi:hypothetical protein